MPHEVTSGSYSIRRPGQSKKFDVGILESFENVIKFFNDGVFFCKPRLASVFLESSTMVVQPMLMVFMSCFKAFKPYLD